MMGKRPVRVPPQWRIIIGPADVLAVEVFGGQAWQSTVSADGVASEIARVSKRTSVSP
jgi:hypothetical protein